MPIAGGLVEIGRDGRVEPEFGVKSAVTRREAATEAGRASGVERDRGRCGSANGWRDGRIEHKTQAHTRMLALALESV